MRMAPLAIDHSLALVRTAYEQVLGIKNPRTDASLADLGGTSLDSTEIVMLLEEFVHADLPQDLLDHDVSSIEEVADRLRIVLAATPSGEQSDGRANPGDVEDTASEQ